MRVYGCVRVTHVTHVLDDPDDDCVTEPLSRVNASLYVEGWSLSPTNSFIHSTSDLDQIDLVPLERRAIAGHDCHKAWVPFRQVEEITLDLRKKGHFL